MANTLRWAVAEPPAAYGAVADDRRCRYVRASRTSNLDQLKRAVLKGYEDQYAPAAITLFTRQYDDDPKAIRERGLAKSLSYAPDWEGVAPPHDDGTCLLVVSPLNEEESELLVLPAAFSAPAQLLLADLTPPSGTSAAVSAALPTLRRLADADESLFDPLPLPTHVDDWLAQIREAPQSLSDLLRAEARPVPSPSARAICMQPLTLPGRDGATAAAEAALFRGVAAFLGAFFHGTEVMDSQTRTGPTADPPKGNRVMRPPRPDGTTRPLLLLRSL
jgi:hypothetical protein